MNSSKSRQKHPLAQKSSAISAAPRRWQEIRASQEAAG